MACSLGRHMLWVLISNTSVTFMQDVLNLHTFHMLVHIFHAWCHSFAFCLSFQGEEAGVTGECFRTSRSREEFKSYERAEWGTRSQSKKRIQSQWSPKISLKVSLGWQVGMLKSILITTKWSDFDRFALYGLGQVKSCLWEQKLRSTCTFQKTC